MKTVLIISQVYVPDPASVGQYMHDAAVELVDRGYRVVVYASARGYDDATARYPRREVRDGVEIRRLPLSSFGKASIKVRLLAQSLFLLQVMARGLFTRGLKRILVSTSPPMASTAAIFIRFFRRVPITFWVMDINPDQAVAMGQVKAGSVPARVFDAINRAILRRARGVVALDRFMAARMEAKRPVGDRMAVLPPWPHEGCLEPVAKGDNPFVPQHDLQDKFVVMYSGNISPAHPVTTILEAARQMQGDPRVLFLFIGGGAGKRRIDDYIAQHRLSNLRTLDYLPMDQIKYSLSAGDVHLVSMGEEMVGIVHPSKIYAAMTVAKPVLLLGPRESHVGELLAEHDFGWQIDHGDVSAAVQRVQQLAQMPPAELAERGARARQAIRGELSMRSVRGRFCDIVEWDHARGP